MIKSYFFNTPGMFGLRHHRLIFVVLAMQLVIVGLVDRVSFDAARAVLIASYVLMLLALAPNLRNPAVGLIFAGAALNFLVISANGGAMPVDPWVYGRDPVEADTAWKATEFLPFSKDAVRLAEQTRLRLLADRLTFPGGIRFAFSIGDVLVTFGIAMLALGGVRRFKRVARNQPRLP